MKDKCSIEKCLNRMFCKNLCRAHYRRFIKYGNPLEGVKEVLQRKNMDCSVLNCGGMSIYKGFCQKHYKNFIATGDPLKIKERKKHKIIPNNYRYLDEKTIEIDLSLGKKGLLDADKYSLIKNFRWSAARRKNNEAIYAVSHEKVPPYKIVRMHRLIMGCPPDKEVDHINGSTSSLDNRISNLRIVTDSQNGMNRPLLSNNFSGHKNLFLKNGKWVVQVRLNKKLHSSIPYSNIDEALLCRERMLRELHGEFSRIEG